MRREEKRRRLSWMFPILADDDDDDDDDHDDESCYRHGHRRVGSGRGFGWRALSGAATAMVGPWLRNG